jgi:hypothetical protein
MLVLRAGAAATGTNARERAHGHVGSGGGTLSAPGGRPRCFRFSAHEVFSGISWNGRAGQILQALAFRVVHRMQRKEPVPAVLAAVRQDERRDQHFRKTQCRQPGACRPAFVPGAPGHLAAPHGHDHNGAPPDQLEDRWSRNNEGEQVANSHAQSSSNYTRSRRSFLYRRCLPAYSLSYKWAAMRPRNATGRASAPGLMAENGGVLKLADWRTAPMIRPDKWASNHGTIEILRVV